jgi:hypothetical protein
MIEHKNHQWEEYREDLIIYRGKIREKEEAKFLRNYKAISVGGI